MTVALGGGVAFPDVTVMQGVSTSFYGVLQRPYSLVIDTGAVFTLYPGSASVGMGVGVYNFASIEVNGTGQFTAGSVSVLAVNESFSMYDSARVSMTAAVGGVSVMVDRFDMNGSSVFTWTGQATVTAASGIIVGYGSWMNGNGGGYGSGVGVCGSVGAGTGGSHGGYGSSGSNGVGSVAPCTSLTWPMALGSGGGAWSQPGGAGGASLVLVSNASAFSAVVINGSITVDGVRGSSDCSGGGGGGSGGSISINASTLLGAGSMTAIGAPGGQCVSCVYVWRGLGRESGGEGGMLRTPAGARCMSFDCGVFMQERHVAFMEEAVLAGASA